ncbi:MAG TPA: efflux RND transporter periplasmic adaptor subunit [Burkholderiaceae bacterium]
MNEVDLNRLRIHRNAESPGIRRQPRRWLWPVLALLAVGAIGGYFIQNPPATTVQTTQAVTAFPSSQFVALNATGYVVARRKASVASKGTGRLEWLGVTEGSKVKAGELIARLESRDVSASLQSATANNDVALASIASANTELADAQQNLRRVEDLFQKQFVSQTAFDDAKSRVARALAATNSAKASQAASKANESFARNAVEYTNIRAPFDGVVISKTANVGDVVTPLSSAADAKGAVVVIADLGTLEVDADVSESALASIVIDQPCIIVLDAFPKERWRGRVSTIVPTVKRSSATVTVKVQIMDLDARILPDMSAKVSFLTQPVDLATDLPAVAVNPAAIVREGTQAFVFRVEPDATVQRIPVTPGVKSGDVQFVAGALKASDVLVVSPSDGMKSGARVRVADRK